MFDGRSIAALIYPITSAVIAVALVIGFLLDPSVRENTTMTMALGAVLGFFFRDAATQTNTAAAVKVADAVKRATGENGPLNGQ